MELVLKAAENKPEANKPIIIIINKKTPNNLESTERKQA